MARKSETEKQLTTAASLIGACHGRLAVMIARERCNLADVRATISDLHTASLTLVDLAHVLEEQLKNIKTVPVGSVNSRING